MEKLKELEKEKDDIIREINYFIKKKGEVLPYELHRKLVMISYQILKVRKGD